jgi:hypothetical protein
MFLYTVVAQQPDGTLFYYVGTSEDPQRRFKEHLAQGSRCAKVLLNREVLSIDDIKLVESKDDEDNRTLDLMHKYGIDHVRGGQWAYENLSGETVRHLQSRIRQRENLCFKCGKAGHYASQCDQIICYLCKREGHLANKCDQVVCYRCKQKGHFANACPGHMCPLCSQRHPGRDCELCTKCGNVGHSILRCPLRICQTCKQPGHDERDCNRLSCVIL